MCPPNDDAAKLWDYLDRPHREQIAEQMEIENESNTIRQLAGGFSLFNFQWARLPFSSLPSSASQSSFFAGCAQKNSVIANTDIVSSCQPSLLPSCQGRLPLNGRASLSPEARVFIPWRRLNGSGRPPVGQVCRIPTSLPLDPLFSCRSPSFPRSPMTGQRWNGVDTPSIPSPGRTLVKPSPTTAALPSPSLPVSSRSVTRNRSQGERAPGRLLPSGRPQCLVPLPGRDSQLPPLSQSQKRSISSSLPGGRRSTPQSLLFIPSGKLSGKRDQPECFPGKSRPAHSVSGYNEMGVAGDRPGSVMSMRVVF